MKLSIITINYNDAIGLKRTLDSVVSQTPCDCEVEHVIIDGGSTDNSVDVIKQYPHVSKWGSEKDKGVYNAMNKGIKMATGDYIQILNSGDILAAPDVLSRMFNFVHSNIQDQKNNSLNLESKSNSHIRTFGIEENSLNSLILEGYPDLLYGNMIRQRADGTIEGKSRQVPYSLLNYFTSTMNHDCCWMKRSLFEEYGLYDENLKIVSDWKWFLQAIGLGHVKPVYVDIDMTIFDTTGISERNLALRNEERRKVLEEVLPPAVLADYDKHAFDMHQMDNLRKHPWAYKLVWTLERILNRLDNRNFKKPKK